jgi:hypothetical protein
LATSAATNSQSAFSFRAISRFQSGEQHPNLLERKFSEQNCSVRSDAPHALTSTFGDRPKSGPFSDHVWPMPSDARTP